MNIERSAIFLVALTALVTDCGSKSFLFYFTFLCAFDVGALVCKTVNVSCTYP